MRTRLRPEQRQKLADILQEEIESAQRRITERLLELEVRPTQAIGDTFDGIRRFYEDLAETQWTEADEDSLKNLGAGEDEIKRHFCGNTGDVQ